MMTLEEISAHADQLDGRLAAERHKVNGGGYGYDRRANLRLIEALEGRITELREQILAEQKRQATTVAAGRPACAV